MSSVKMDCCNYLDYRSLPHRQAGFAGYSDPYQGCSTIAASSYYPPQYHTLQGAGIAPLTEGFSGIYADYYGYPPSLDYSSAYGVGLHGSPEIESYSRYSARSYDGYAIQSQRLNEQHVFAEDLRHTKDGRGRHVRERRASARQPSQPTQPPQPPPSPSPHQLHTASNISMDRSSIPSVPYYGQRRMTHQCPPHFQQFHLDCESPVPLATQTPWSHYQGLSGWSMFGSSSERRMSGGVLASAYPCRPHAVYQNATQGTTHLTGHPTSPPHLPSPHPTTPNNFHGHHFPPPEYEHDPLRGMQAMHEECAGKHSKEPGMQFMEHTSHDIQVGLNRQSPSYNYSNSTYSLLNCRSSTPSFSSKLKSKAKFSPMYRDEALPESDRYSKLGQTIKIEAGLEKPCRKTKARGESACGKKMKTSPPPQQEKVEVKVEQVPLPAFQQAFGSTEIGRFSEAFTRSEDTNGEGGITEEMVCRAMSTQSGGFDEDAWSTFDGDTLIQLDASLSSIPAEIM